MAEKKHKLSSLPKYLVPRLRLFLSADLVGSTAFKQQPSYPLKLDSSSDAIGPVGPHWLNPIADFYVDFAAEFSRHWAAYVYKARQAPEWSVGSPPEFWKGIGDEVVFVKELTHPQELYGTLHAWLGAIRSYRKELIEKRASLDVKSSVWAAGFPINNSEVVFDAKVKADANTSLPKTDDSRVSHFQRLDDFYENSSKQSYVRDFIGASIDTGFRIATKASPRRMAISLEVALLLSSITVANNKFPEFRIFFEGYEGFKGVLGGKPYPIFWIDVFADNALAEVEDRMVGREPVSSGDLRKFCEAFIAQNSNYLIRPFIVDCMDPNFATLPENYWEKLYEWRRKIGLERKRYENELKDVEASEAPLDALTASPAKIKELTEKLKMNVTNATRKKRKNASKKSS